jgi:hypothetical protein
MSFTEWHDLTHNHKQVRIGGIARKGKKKRKKVYSITRHLENASDFASPGDINRKRQKRNKRQ